MRCRLEINVMKAVKNDGAGSLPRRCNLSWMFVALEVTCAGESTSNHLYAV